MTITDKLCFGISIAILTIYISLFAVTQIIGYGPVNQPISNGKLCNRIYFPDLKDLSQTLCLNQCPKEGDKKLDCDNCHGNVYNTLEYDKGCLPNLYQQLQQTMPALKTPIISDFSESLILNCYFVFLGLLFLLCISNYCQYFYRRYSNLILTFLSNYYPYGLLWLAILMAHKISVFHDIDKLQRAGESRILNIHSIEILVEAFNHKTTYYIILAILIKIFLATVITLYFQSPDLEDNRLKGYISLRLRNQTITYQKYNYVLQILFTLNFLIFYFSLAASLSIGSINQQLVAYSQYQPSIVGYILSLTLFILFIYTSKILRLYTDLYIYSFSLQYLFGWQDTGVEFTKESLSFFGTVSLLAFKQIINSPKKLLIPLLKLLKKDEKAKFYESELQLLTSLTLGRQMYHYLENKQNQGGVAPYNFQDSCNALNIQQLDIVFILYERCEKILKHSGWSVGTLIGLFNILIGCSFSTIFVMILLCCDFNYCYNAFNVKGYLTIGLIEGDNADKLMNLYKSIINIEMEEQKVQKQ